MSNDIEPNEELVRLRAENAKLRKALQEQKSIHTEGTADDTEPMENGTFCAKDRKMLEMILTTVKEDHKQLQARLDVLQESTRLEQEKLQCVQSMIEKMNFTLSAVQEQQKSLMSQYAMKELQSTGSAPTEDLIHKPEIIKADGRGDMLDQNDLDRILQYTKSASSEWRKIGKELGFTDDNLDSIQNQSSEHTVDDFYKAMLKGWLDGAPLSPSLQCLLTAFRAAAVNRAREANNLEAFYGVLTMECECIKTIAGYDFDWKKVGRELLGEKKFKKNYRVLSEEVQLIGSDTWRECNDSTTETEKKKTMLLFWKRINDATYETLLNALREINTTIADNVEKLMGQRLPDFLNKKCREIDISAIAEYDFDWIQLGKKLIDDEVIEGIDQNGSSDLEKKKQVLLLWKEARSHDVTYQALVDALRRTGYAAAANLVEELIRQKLPGFLNMECSEMDIYKIAGYDFDWKQLGIKLIDDKVIEDIDQNGNRNLQEKKENMLLSWKKARSPDVTYRALINALRNTGSNATADHVEALIRQKLPDLECSLKDICTIAEDQFDWKELGRTLIGDQKLMEIEKRSDIELERKKIILLQEPKTTKRITYEALVEALKKIGSNATADNVEELKRQRLPDLLNMECSETDISTIAAYNFEWKTVGHKLVGDQMGMNIDKEESENLKREKMLLLWKVTRSHTYQALMDALRGIGNNATADLVGKLRRERLQGETLERKFTTCAPLYCLHQHGYTVEISDTSINTPSQGSTFPVFFGRSASNIDCKSIVAKRIRCPIVEIVNIARNEIQCNLAARKHDEIHIARFRHWYIEVGTYSLDVFLVFDHVKGNPAYRIYLENLEIPEKVHLLKTLMTTLCWLHWNNVFHKDLADNFSPATVNVLCDVHCSIIDFGDSEIPNGDDGTLKALITDIRGFLTFCDEHLCLTSQNLQDNYSLSECCTILRNLVQHYEDQDYGYCLEQLTTAANNKASTFPKKCRVLFEYLCCKANIPFPQGSFAVKIMNELY